MSNFGEGRVLMFINYMVGRIGGHFVMWNGKRLELTEPLWAFQIEESKATAQTYRLTRAGENTIVDRQDYSLQGIIYRSHQ